MFKFISKQSCLVPLTLVACSVIWTTAGDAAEVQRPLSERFAEPSADETPDFQRHVMPLLGRLGCNGRACHGSFQGRGGFQLSLFGYDFKADHEALLDEASGRVDVDDVDESLILYKPTDADQHEGGKRFDNDSWQHHVLKRWIEMGADFRRNQVQTLDRLTVAPDQLQFDSNVETIQLSVVATWEDGTQEDVTELCRFYSNDDAIAVVDEHGQVSSQASGDTHVVVSYDKAVVPVQVIRPYENDTAIASSQSTNRIDQIVQTKLNQLRIAPSPACSDEDFLRRVSLDISGMLPSAQAVRDFIADDAADKRTRLIDELLDSSGYAAWWATRFSDWTGNNAEQLNNALPIRNAAGRLWYEWLRTRIENNVPYDEIVEGIVVANSRQSDESYLEYCEAMTRSCQSGNEKMFAARDGLSLFWNRKNFRKPDDRAIGFAYTFLGVRLECAQCHKHPFDRWSKDDFQNFAQLFSPIRANPNTVAPDGKQDRQELINKITDGKELKGGKLRKSIYAAAKEGKVVPFSELLVNTQAIKARARKAARKRGKNAPMRIPSGKILGELSDVSLDSDTRPALMHWLRSPDNPYFARAIVNRVWSNYFGIGIVDPTDDMNLGNPPSNAELLDYLADEFIAQDFDLKWLHRQIVTSDTYQRSAEPTETNIHDRANFSRHVPRRLPAEVLVDSAMLATGSDRQAARLREELKGMAIANGKSRVRKRTDFAMTVFGQSIRESNCDCDRSNDPSLLQSIYLRNDRDIHTRLTNDQGWVAQACAAIGTPGPKSGIRDKQTGAARRAEAIQNRFLLRISKYKNQSKVQQKKQRAQLKQEHRRITEKAKLLGYQVPELDQLLKDDHGWENLQVRTDKPEKTGHSLNDIVEEAYLRALCRFPNDEELQISTSFISESETPAKGIESLMWALINTKEFIITH